MRVIFRVTWNLFFAGRPETHSQRKRLTWYQARWRLWKKYTEPSLLRQTYGAFNVWLLCDPMLKQLTDWMIRKLPDDRFRVVYNHNEAARAVASGKPDKIIYARIDNDDILAPDAVRRLVAASDSSSEYIQFAEGYVLDTSSGRIWESNNPSPAILAKVGDWRMMARGAPAMLHHGKVCDVALRLPSPAFCITVHGNNVCNRATGNWIKREIVGKEKERVYAEYGLEKADGDAGSSQ